MYRLAGGSDPPQHLGPRVNRGRGATKKKRPHYVLKVIVPTPTLAPITSPIDVAANMPSQARQVLPPVTTPSLFVAFAPSPSPTVSSTSLVPSPLPEVSPLSTPSPLSGHSRGHGHDAQSYIDDGTPCIAALPMISPNGQG